MQHLQLIFSKHKLNTLKQCLQRLWMIILAIATCGSILAELDLDKDFKDVEIRDHTCVDVIEKPYHSAKLEPTVELIGPSHNEYLYPQCKACSSHEPGKK